MKKNLFRTLLFIGSLALMSFDDVETNSSGSTSGRRPMFGSNHECMQAIHWPNGDCTKECRNHTYIFWIDFASEWETEKC
jgi:hypothetical protein